MIALADRATLRAAIVAIALLVLLAPVPLGAARSETFSWGRSGISIEQYRRDAVECGRAGYYLDVSGTEGARILKGASRQLENNETNLQAASSMVTSQPSPEQRASAISNLNAIVGQSARIVQQARPDEQIRQVGGLMQGTVDGCLRGRGYVRFRLTAAQRKQLQHLHLGSPERHEYLFRLATDPAVLDRQKD